MSAQGPRRERVRVTRHQPRSFDDGRGGSHEIDEQTAVGETYMRSLVRTQFRLGLATLASVLVPLAALPLLLVLAPSLGELSLGPIPGPWLLLGVAVYPALVLIGWRYVRQAERNEAEFERIVTRQ